MTAWVKEIKKSELTAVSNAPQGLWKRYVSLDPVGRGMIFGMGCLQPGEEINHSHIEEELFYVLSGTGEATWIEDEQTHITILKPGVAFYKTSDIEHCMRNNSSEPLIGIFFKV